MSIFEEYGRGSSPLGNSQASTYEDKEDWEWNPMERIEASLQESFGSLWGMIGAAADAMPGDTKVMRGLEEFSMRRGSELMELAADHDFVKTEFKDIDLSSADGIANGAKYIAELGTSYIPDFLMMFLGGAGAGTAASKMAAKGYGKTLLEQAAKKRLKDRMEEEFKDKTFDQLDDALKRKLVRETARDIGSIAGAAGYEGAQMGGSFYQGNQEAGGLRALGVGAGGAAIGAFSPLNRLASKLGAGRMLTKGGIVKDLAVMSVGEAAEEVSQEAWTMLNEAGIDPNVTVGAMMSSEEGMMRLLESGIAGAILGGSFGAGTKAVFGREPEKKDKVKDVTKVITETPEAVVQAAGIDTSQDTKVPSFMGGSFSSGEFSGQGPTSLSNLFDANAIARPTNLADRFKEIENERAAERTIDEVRAGEGDGTVRVMEGQEVPGEGTVQAGETAGETGEVKRPAIAPLERLPEDVAPPILPKKEKTPEELALEAERLRRKDILDAQRNEGVDVEEERVTDRQKKEDAEIAEIRAGLTDTDVRKGWQGKAVTIGDKKATARVNGDFAILKVNDNKFELVERVEGGYRRFGNFQRQSDAMEAAELQLTREEYDNYKKLETGEVTQKKEDDIELKTEAKKMLEDLGYAEGGIDKLVRIIKAKSGSVAEENNDAIIESIYKNVSKYDPKKKGKTGKVATLESFLIGRGMNAVQDWRKKQGKELQETVQEADEGSRGSGTIESATEATVRGATPINEPTQAKVSIPGGESRKIIKLETGYWKDVETGKLYSKKKPEAVAELQKEYGTEVTQVVLSEEEKKAILDSMKKARAKTAAAETVGIEEVAEKDDTEKNDKKTFTASEMDETVIEDTSGQDTFTDVEAEDTVPSKAEKDVGGTLRPRDIMQEPVFTEQGEGPKGKEQGGSVKDILKKQAETPRDSNGKPLSKDAPKGAKVEGEKIGKKTIYSIKEYSEKMYHGTPEVYEGPMKEGRPIFFTENKDQAETYGENVMEKKVSLKNPFVIDWEGKPWHEGPNGVGSAMQLAKRVRDKGGFDGVLFLNIIDPGPKGEGKKYDHSPTNQVAFFSNESLSEVENETVEVSAASEADAQVEVEENKDGRLSREEELELLMGEQAEDMEANEAPEIDPDIAHLSYKIYEKAGFNSQKALEDFDNKHGIEPKTEKLRAIRENLVRVNNFHKAEAERLGKKYKNGLELLEDSVKKTDDPKVAALGKMLLNHAPTRAKLKNVPVEVIANGSSSYLTALNTIRLSGGAGTTGVHEVVHAITVHEMDNNSDLRTEVERMLAIARRRISEDPKWKKILTSDLVDFVSDLETSKNYKESQEVVLMGIPKDLSREANSILYGLLNRKEFLSQAFTSPAFQEFLKTIEVDPPDGVKSGFRKDGRSKWNAFREFIRSVGKLFGISDTSRLTLLEQALEVTERLAESEGYSGLTAKDSGGVDSLTNDSIQENFYKEPVQLNPKKSTKTFEQRRKELAVMPRQDKLKTKAERFAGNLKSAFQNIGQSVSETVRGIDPKFLMPLRKMEYTISTRNKEMQDKVKPFIDAYRKLNDADKTWVDYLLTNRDDPETQEQLAAFIKEKPDFGKGLAAADGVLAQIYTNAKNNNMNKYGDKDVYFPRRVSDIMGLMQAMRGDPEYGKIQAELDNLRKRVKGPDGEYIWREPTQQEKEDAVRTMLNTGRFPAMSLKDPTAMKLRKINKISSEWTKFYQSADKALIDHIYDMNEETAKREFFRDPERAKLVKQRDKMYAAMEAGKDVDEAELAVIEARLNDIQASNTAAIEQMIADNGSKLSMEDQDSLMRALRARLTQRGMSGAASTLRNISLMSALGSPTSAITQIGDLAFSLYNNGVFNTLTGLGGALRGNSLIKPSDMDLTGSLKEYQQEGTAKYLDKVLTLSGLKKMDSLFKQTTMNAVLKQAKGMSYEEFEKRYMDIYQHETKATYDAIQKGIKNEHSMFFAFNELSDFQPVSLSEMPAMYLTAGNGRIFYALKSYNIRALNTIWRETVGKYKNAKDGEGKRAAAANALRLVGLMVLMGASADEIKDWITGKEAGTFSDSVTENLLKTTMLNRYTLSKGFKSDTLKNILADTLIPPTQWAMDPMADLYSWVQGDKPTFKSINSLPWGKVLYSNLIPGAKDYDMSMLQREIMASYADGASFSKIRSKMNTYNAWARQQEDKKPITLSTLTKAKQRKRQAELKGE